MEERTIIICLNTDKGEFPFTLNNIKATALDEYGQVDQLEIVNIAGDYKKVADLLTGKTKLRESISNQYLTISSTLRTTLALESIFFWQIKKIRVFWSDKFLNILTLQNFLCYDVFKRM